MNATLGRMEAERGTIVVIEDDRNIASLIDMYLRREGHRVISVADGESGLLAVKREKPRLVILDIGLPGSVDGFEVCRQLRASGPVPVMIVTARDEEIDRVLGFELGADDYLTKPFSPREMTARVKAILRRVEAPPPETPSILKIGNVEVDTGRRESRVDGNVVALATREFDLLKFLANNRGLALSRQQILEGVWGIDWYGDNRTVDVHIGQLRKKLGDAFPLATVWGVGYRLD